MMKIPTIGRKNKRKILGSVVGKPENSPLRIYKQNDHEESIPIYLQEKNHSNGFKPFKKKK